MDPLTAVARLRDDYVRYLQTIYAFRDDGLRAEFNAALTRDRFLVEGPILQAARPFEQAESIADLVAEGVLQPAFRAICSQALPYERPLFRHQAEAIRKIVVDRRNVVVATGTGSGKTEAFLIPILEHLLAEQAQGTLRKEGVRALLLYPMNALANDQLRRLRRVLEKVPEITFGRYTGETRQSQSEAESLFRQQFHDDPLLPNELLSRDAIRKSPPHLLLTNYSMLEYLLLRPIDSELFDGSTGRHWRFIVLDEAHVYDGAGGAELAMLLRRLKDRVVRSESGRIQTIATSATLGQGRADHPAVAEYASALLGEPVDWVPHDPTRQDVVEATYRPWENAAPVWGAGNPPLYAALRRAVEAGAGLASVSAAALANGVPATVAAAQSHATQSSNATESYLFYVLRGDERLRQLQHLLSTPQFLADLPALLPGEDEQQAIVDLVALAVRARQDEADAPLLPARYHTFARALEGAYLCLNSGHPAHARDGKPRLLLSRHERCPMCDALVFELASCPRCGATYLVGREKHDDVTGGAYSMLAPAGDPGGALSTSVRYFVWEDAASSADEDEAAVEGDESTLKDGLSLEEIRICLACGAMSSMDSMPCGCGKATATLRRVNQKDDRLTRCVVCGATRGGHPVYRFLTGKDAPVAVLATSLYQQQLPPSGVDAVDLPGDGRKLLSFSDSRQDAAFFAHYLQRTYEQILHRALIYATLRDEPARPDGELRLADLIGRVREKAEEAGFFVAAQSPDGRRRLAATWLTHEFAPTDVRISLEGTGLLLIRPARPKNWMPPPALLDPPWNLTKDEAWTLISVLLDSLRQQGVVAPPAGVDFTEAVFRPRNLPLYLSLVPNVKKHVFGWLPSDDRYSNRRLDYLTRLLRRCAFMGQEEAKGTARAALNGLWSHLSSSPQMKGYLATETVRGIGQVYRLDTSYWEWVLPSGKVPAYRCSRCGLVRGESLGGVCPTNGCDGTLLEMPGEKDGWETNHYHHTYRNLALVPMEAQEHTAQWRSEKAAEIQSQFVRGEVNVLSCSTTFELGVDVGTLDMVLMRNVPPSTANYVQRAGRAGRRAGSVPFVVTYCQRRSHDLWYYRHPMDMVMGHVRAPAIELCNEVIARRHVYAVLYASFLRDVYSRTNAWPNRVGDMIAAHGHVPVPQLLRIYLKGRPTAVRDALLRLVPGSLCDTLDIAQWGWVHRLTNADGNGILDEAEQELAHESLVYATLVSQAAQEEKYWLADRLRRVVKTVTGRDLIGFLASRNILPKYGFPTDVVPLRTDHIDRPEAAQLELERDLSIALSEYAPGSELVAARLLWRGGGIYKLPGKEWESFHYAVCPHCGRFARQIEPLGPTCAVCKLPLHRPGSHSGQYIIPRFGFIADRHVDEPGQAQPERSHASRVYFGHYAQGNPEVDRSRDLFLPDPLFSCSARYSRFGQLHVINSGHGNAGFRVCERCGWSAPAGQGKARSGSHSDPRSGIACNGPLRTLHLGHEFITDVLELRFAGPGVPITDDALWWSVLYALVQGACDAMHISRDDVGGTLYRFSSDAPPALILYDNVPGGAGHLRNVIDSLEEVLRAAYNRVADCECGPETTCYQCLRDYYNQYHHDLLKRGLAAGFLRRLLNITATDFSRDQE